MRRCNRNLACALILLWAAIPPAWGAERLLEQEFSATGIDSFSLEAGNGSARIAVGDQDRIRVQVRITPKRWTDDEPWRKVFGWFLTSEYEDVNDLIAAVRLDVPRVLGSTLRVALLPSGRTRESRIAEEWTVTIPSRLAVRLQMDATEANISGAEGGVTVNAGFGSVLVDVPHGRLDIETKVGKIRLLNAGDAIGDVQLGSRVGHVSLRLDGRNIQVPSEPGPGAHVSVKGNGRDTVRAWIEVGDIDALLGKTE